MAETETKLVAFVDILGFSELIKAYDAGKNDQIFSLLKNAVDPAANFMRESFELAKGGPFFNWKDCLDIRLFSDCLCAAAPTEYQTYGFMDQLIFFYKYLMGYQYLLMGNGFFTRGGVTIGSHYADNNMIFSGGLVEAHELECKYAVYPRIILSNRLVDMIMEQQKGYEKALDHMLVRGTDGYVFFNHFNFSLIDAANDDEKVAAIVAQLGMDGLFGGETLAEQSEKAKQGYVAEIKAIAIKMLETNDNERIQEKYKWLLHYIDYEAGGNQDFKSFSQW